MKNLKKATIILVFILALFLRFYKLGQVPPSLYWEEAALGYDAYSILKTGKDYHGNSFPIIAFESFGDWKPSLYFYFTVPSIALFGLNEFSVRFPSAFFGSLTVLVVYFLVKELFSRPKEKPRGFPSPAYWRGNSSTPGLNNLAGLASFLLAISPWHLQFSRAAFEANLALFFIVLGVWAFLRAVNGRPFFLILSSLSFSLCFYAYHAARLFAPLLAGAFGLLFAKKLWRQKGTVLFSLFLALLLIAPVIKQFNQPEIKKRFQETSALATIEPVLESNQKIAEDGGTRLAKIVHHRFWHYLDIFLIHYFDHFRPEFLFLEGDVNPRHQTGEFGLFYLAEVPFLLLGIYFVLAQREKWGRLLFIWLILAPVPAGLTKATPHALRFLISLPVWSILTAYGLLAVWRGLRKRTFCPVYHLAILGFFCLCLFRYFHFYYHHYGQIYSQSWQYGYREMINYVLSKEEDYDQICITRDHGRPSIYYFFYGRIDPRQVQAWEEKAAHDQGEFLEFDKIKFGDCFLETGEGQRLAVISESDVEKLEDKPEILEMINFLDGQPAFLIYED